jgi:hypothetical protein
VPLPSAFAEERIEELVGFVGLKKVLVVVNFGSWNKDRFHRKLKPSQRDRYALYSSWM